jgi:hypothetical protein
MAWHPTLDSIERRVESYTPGWRKRTVQDPDRALGPVLGVGGGCWCGEIYGHDWPGKDEGAVHPRA